MPSNLSVPVTRITKIRKHPDADRLQLAEILGWQVVIGTGGYTEGERLVYLPPDCLIGESLADALEIKQHLQTVKNPDGTLVTSNGETMFRVRQAKLRGEPSFGTTIPASILKELYAIDINELEDEAEMAEILGILKYEPAMRATAGDADVDHPAFIKYTDVENLRRYPNTFINGEVVTLSEKIHGTNCRVGIIEGVLMAGSHGLRRKLPDDSKAMASNMYWYPITNDNVRNMLEDLGKKHKQVILFGETYGKVQKKYSYGVPNGLEFRAFDLFVDGKYVDWEDFINLCVNYGVKTVPQLGVIPYSLEAVKNIVDNMPSSTLDESHPVEGVVVKPLKERRDNKIGRVVLKYISDAYLFDKGGSDYKDI